MNPALMTKCPTQLGYGAIDAMKPENLTLVNLYKVNEILCVIIMLGQGKSLDQKSKRSQQISVGVRK